MSNDKIFISHSSKDIDFVKSFVEQILRLGLNIPSGRIFCSSMHGYEVGTGQYIPDRLRTEINQSCVALLFISKNYRSSEICLNEVGAAWATLNKEAVIPFLLPGADFKEVGFLDLNRLGLRISERDSILKFAYDCKVQLNPELNFNLLSQKVDDFLKEINRFGDLPINNDDKTVSEFDEWKECFENNFYPLNEIIRKAIPTHNDGIYRIRDIKTQTQILTDLSKAKFLQHFWYRHAEGDYYVERIKKTPNGTWLISIFNWEVRISDMWVCMNSELQYEFILIKSVNQGPFKIDTDVGGTSYSVGILNDGTIVSENERLNGFAIIKGETIDLSEYGVEMRVRDDEDHWVFLVSQYHKLGFNYRETEAFCKKLDSGEIEVNEVNISGFLRQLRNHPVVIQYR